jgi:hypothetical protein
MHNGAPVQPCLHGTYRATGNAQCVFPDSSVTNRRYKLSLVTRARHNGMAYVTHLVACGRPNQMSPSFTAFCGLAREAPS